MTGPVCFWWVRHGPTDATGLNGWTDVPARLDETDRLARLGSFLPLAAPVISSDLIRAVATADAIARDRPRLGVRQGLREMHFGAWEGRSIGALQQEDPERLFSLWDRPGDTAPPGGESWNALAARVSAEVDALVTAAGGPDLIVVAHLGAILTQLARARGAAPKEILSQGVGHLSVTRIRWDGRTWSSDLADHSP